ncbi:MAG: hypothetical protein ACI8UZ_001839 [Akkermansiaceae bacterium]|jgi:hypothetical protein
MYEVAADRSSWFRASPIMGDFGGVFMRVLERKLTLA